MKYCESTFQYKRIQTKEVRVGNIGIGGNNPIRIQSMTNTDTDDIKATVDQIMELSDIGCEIVRVTVPNIKSAENLERIVNTLRQKNYTVPLVADIHFTPNAAMKAVEFVEKIRVNPGNYADKKKFAVLEYTDQAYQDELDRIEEKFTPLVEKCKQYNRAIRIGTNHGSLSDRIMNRYGDSPHGMVESAWEFARICQANDFENFLFSMKASNTQVMIEAYRMLLARMYEENNFYPTHLGVTEAGDGADGRIKSFIGIGSLLDDGIGDTIRVSLTESPLKEIPVAKELANLYNAKRSEQITNFKEEKRTPFEFKKRDTYAVNTMGDEHIPPVILFPQKRFSNLSDEEKSALRVTDISTGNKAEKFILTSNSSADLDAITAFINQYDVPMDDIYISGSYVGTFKHKFVSCKEKLNDEHSNGSVILELDLSSKSLEESKRFIQELSMTNQTILTLKNGTVAQYRLLNEFTENTPLLIQSVDTEDFLTHLSIVGGSLLCDGIGNGVISTYPDSLESIKTCFNVLQGTRARITKTEFISCPSCGRTLFDLEETTARIKERTNHLKGVKIAIMGCIVNGPGEMADADFGYVGAGVGKINLYVGKDVVKRNIETPFAVDELVSLIKDHDMWIEP